MYAIKTPTGWIIEDTAAPSKAKSYDNFWDRHPYFAMQYGRSNAHEFARRLRRAGYRCVKIVVIEA